MLDYPYLADNASQANAIYTDMMWITCLGELKELTFLQLVLRLE
jgi:hypothetical protein